MRAGGPVIAKGRLMVLSCRGIGSPQSGRAGLRRRLGVAGQSQRAPTAQCRRGELHYAGARRRQRDAGRPARCRRPAGFRPNL